MMAKNNFIFQIFDYTFTISFVVGKKFIDPINSLDENPVLIPCGTLSVVYFFHCVKMVPFSSNLSKVRETTKFN